MHCPSCRFCKAGKFYMQRPEVVIDPVNIDHHVALVGIDYFWLTEADCVDR